MFVESIFSLLMLQNDNEKLRNVQCIEQNCTMHVCVFTVRVLNAQLVSVFNFIVTVGGSFAFAYKATEYAMETPNYPLVSCVFFSLT